MKRTIAILILFACQIAHAQQPAEPLRVKDAAGAVHGKIELAAETMGKFVRWRLIDPGPLLIDDLPDLRTRKQAILYSCKPGKFRVECWTAINDEPSAIVVCVVTIVGEPQPPPPPEPPVPPPPPPPADPLTAALQLCYNQDPQLQPIKAAHLQRMIGLYQAMTIHAADKGITKLADLLSDYQKTAAGMPNELIGCRKLVAAEIAAALGTNTNAMLDDAMRQRAVDLFARLAKAASGVKQ